MRDNIQEYLSVLVVTKKQPLPGLSQTDADVLFYGRHNNPHTFFPGYLLRSSNYTSDVSILQREELK